MGDKVTWNEYLNKNIKSLNAKVGMIPVKNTPKAPPKISEKIKKINTINTKLNKSIKNKKKK